MSWLRKVLIQDTLQLFQLLRTACIMDKISIKWFAEIRFSHCMISGKIICFNQFNFVCLLQNRYLQNLFQGMLSLKIICFLSFDITVFDILKHNFFWHEFLILYTDIWNIFMVSARHNSSVLAMELCLSCTNPSMWSADHLRMISELNISNVICSNFVLSNQRDKFAHGISTQLP